jgi:serine/threonine-protein kinase
LVHGALCPEELIALPGSGESFSLAAFGPEDREARSLAYLAPEQAESSVISTPQLDVWALGVMLFEALAAERPFSGDSPPLVLVRVLTEVAPPLRQVWPDAPSSLARVIDRALRPDPSGRPSSMRGFVTLLTDAAAEDGITIA